MVILGREDIIERAEQGIRSEVRAREGERQERDQRLPHCGEVEWDSMVIRK